MLMILVATTANGQGARSVHVGATVTETDPGCFTCTLIVSPFSGGPAVLVYHLNVRSGETERATWSERDKRGRSLRYTLSCAVRQDASYANLIFKVDGKSARASPSFAQHWRVMVERRRE